VALQNPDLRPVRAKIEVTKEVDPFRFDRCAKSSAA